MNFAFTTQKTLDFISTIWYYTARKEVLNYTQQNFLSKIKEVMPMINDNRKGIAGGLVL